MIAVKREASGRGGSISMVDDVNVGDLLYVSLPRNEFELSDERAELSVHRGRHRHHADPLDGSRTSRNDGDKPFKLYYLSRDAASRPPTATSSAAPAAPRQGRRASRLRRSRPIARPLARAREAQEARTSIAAARRRLMDAVRDMTGHWPTVGRAFRGLRHAQAPRTRERQAVHRAPRRATATPIEIPADVSILEGLRAHGSPHPQLVRERHLRLVPHEAARGEADHRDLVLTDCRARCARSPSACRARIRPSSSSTL